MALAVSTASFCSAGIAFAQEIPRGETVQSRAKPELDPLGVKAGSFLFFPKATLSDTYNDNIFSSANGALSDNIVELGLNGSLESDWSNHSLKLAADTKIKRYIDNPDENYENFDFSADGRYDVSADAKLTAGSGILLSHESRSSTDDAGGIKPTEYSKVNLTGGAEKGLDKYSLKGGFVVDKYDYKDVATTSGVVNNDDRDRLEFLANIRAGYEFKPQTEAFIRLELNAKDYRDALDDNGVNRDSDGFEVTSGLSFDLTGITFGNVFAGYRSQTFKDSSLKKAEGPTAGLDLTWNATTLTTIKGSFERSVEETTTTGASGIFRNKATISLDHELLRNMILSSKFTYTDNDFVGISRKDKESKLELGVDYKLFRNFYTNFNYTYSKRDSSTNSADYKQNLFKILLSVQL